MRDVRPNDAQDMQDKIETMIDSHGLGNVLYALATVLEAKADHVLENWQDKATAKAWERMSGRAATFGEAAEKAGV